MDTADCSLILSEGAQAWLSDLDTTVILISALVVDIAHPGEPPHMVQIFNKDVCFRCVGCVRAFSHIGLQLLHRSGLSILRCSHYVEDLQ